MPCLNEILADKLVLFSLVLGRVGGLVATAPLFGMSAVPAQVKALLAFALALLVMPLQWNAATACPGGLAEYAIQLGSEIVIGACLGLGVMVLVYALGLAGEMIGHASGLSAADIFDPTTEENVPHFSRLMVLTTVAVFLCIGGHRMVMAGLLDTYRAIPPGSYAAPQPMLDAFLTLIQQSFSLGIRAAAPTVTALLLATVALGLVGRTLPQLNVLAVGFGLNAMLTFAVLGLTLGAAAWAFQDEVEPALRAVLDALHTPLRSEWLS
jgi:flagellar biosynthesis protein FliR